MLKLSLVAVLFLLTIMTSSLFLVSSVDFAAASDSLPSNGLISSDSTWTKANSPYTFTGPVAIKEGVTLTIEPGVVINLGDYYLQVNGTLHAVGSDSERIQVNGNSHIEFEGRDGFVHYGYVGFYDSSSSGCLIENTDFNCDLILNSASPKLNKVSVFTVDVNGGAPIFSNCEIKGGMGVYGSTATVTDCSISGYSGYHGFAYSRIRSQYTLSVGGSEVIAHSEIKGPVYMSGGVNNQITGNTLSGLTVENGGGLVANNEINGWVEILGTTSLTIERNLIQGTSTGILAAGQVTIRQNTIRNFETAIVASSSEPVIVNNNIEGYKFSVNLTSSSDLNVANNWWGTSDQSAIGNSIRDNRKDYNLGTVTFTPILTSPDPEALPDLNIQIPSSTPNQTVEPTPTQTSSPTESPTQNPSDTPLQSNTQTFLGLDIFQVVVVVLLAGIFVALVVLILVLRRRKPK